jgi:ATP-dependent RNA helicase DeaD
LGDILKTLRKISSILELFKHLGLSDQVLKAISELGFETPSEIQERAIPHLLKEDRDFIGLAQTGTGKTAAFGLPLLERIDTTLPYTQALILAPTRELGQQIAKQLVFFAKFMPKVNILPVYGGASISTQIRALKKPQHIIIATPGRLIDLSKRKAVKLGDIKYLILDEADEMLNMGFQEEIDEILNYTPEEKLTWLFSATMPKEMVRIVNQYMDNPLEVKLNRKNVVNANIDHQFVLVKHSDKTAALTRFLDSDKSIRGVVFCRTRRDTQELADELLQRNYKADALHGDLSQRLRDRVMNRFRTNDIQILVATDVAARGIDVNDLTHVFHFALPDDLAYYTHRSGRTARAGKKGISLIFTSKRERSRIDYLSKRLGISFTKTLVPTSADIFQQRITNWALDILEKKAKNKVSQEILEQVNLLFSNLSKEELTAKLLTAELERLNLDSHSDLNEQPGKTKPHGFRKPKPKGQYFKKGKSFNKRGGPHPAERRKAKKKHKNKGSGKKY